MDLGFFLVFVALVAGFSGYLLGLSDGYKNGKARGKQLAKARSKLNARKGLNVVANEQQLVNLETVTVECLYELVTRDWDWHERKRS